MLSDQDRIYHAERARAEFGLATQATNALAAEAHLKLSALHMAQMREMDERCGGAGCDPRS